mgnify:CR=1 FL=1
MAITTTPADILAGALRLIGVVAEGESLSAEQARDGLSVLNEWIDTLELDGLTWLTQSRDVYNLVANQSTYTIGPAAQTPDFSTGTRPRPSQLLGVALLLNTTSPPQEIQLKAMTDEAYQNVGIKTYTNPQPLSYYFNPTMPTAELFLWPTPTTATNDLVIYTGLLTSQFAAVTTSVTLPPGYARMFRTNMAVQLAAEYGRDVPPRVVQMAQESLTAVRQANFTMSDLDVDAGLWPTHRPIYNIWSDQG